MTNEELFAEIAAQRDLMIAVATGGPRIQDLEGEYEERRARIQRGLVERQIADPNPHRDLWSWYGKWRSDLPTYQSRRAFVSNMYGGLVDAIEGQSHAAGASRSFELTGWTLVDRQMERVKQRLQSAATEEDFQSVGHMCRETLISLAQAVYDPATHTSADETEPSRTDAKRMLDAYVSREMSGGSNEAARKHAKAALDLSNGLQHKRTASFRDAALCAEATVSVVNLVAIISGRRDPL